MPLVSYFRTIFFDTEAIKIAKVDNLWYFVKEFC